MRFRFQFIVACLLGLLSLSALAGEEGMPDPQALTAEVDGATVSIEAQNIVVQKDELMEASGNVDLRQGDQKISADYLQYQQQSRDLTARGSVRVEQPSGVMRGPSLKMNLDSNVGEMVQPEFQLSGSTARGSAQMMHRSGKQNYSFDQGTYTTCPAGNDDWLLKMARLEIDRNREIGVARHVVVEFKGVPFLYTPWMDFPLNNNRKSGMLAPLTGSTNKGGSELTLPFYWNIAPEYDATLAPRFISKRGVMLNNEFRYLGRQYSGEAHYDVLPDDKLSKQNRIRMSLKHAQDLGHGFGGLLQLNQVSDNDYFRDLANTVSGTAQTNLLSEAVLTYGAEWWSAMARVQRFQTLQDPLAPVAIPYRRLPQVSLSAQKVAGSGTVTLNSEYVDFRHPTAVNGQRLVVYPTISYPILSDQAYYLTPKLGLHNTRYLMGENNLGNIPDASRTVPIFSLDSGMVFERNFESAGVEYVQTLEPRAFYVRIPYREQNALPNFDSSQAVFNFAQMFTENRFFGSDRIGDANMLTLALSSRFFEDVGGSERLRVAVGERFSFAEPRVNLVAQNGVTNRSDILLSAGGKMSKTLDLDSLYQYNPNQSRTESFNATARYHPEKGKVLNVGYRYTRDLLRHLDVSGQWPLSGRWYGVGRWSYSLLDRHTLEALGGLEYNQDCWMLRLVAQRFATAENQTSTGIFLQLELNDLVRVGSDPLSALRLSVPGYTKLNESSFDKPSSGLR